MVTLGMTAPRKRLPNQVCSNLWWTSTSHQMLKSSGLESRHKPYGRTQALVNLHRNCKYHIQT